MNQIGNLYQILGEHLDVYKLYYISILALGLDENPHVCHLNASKGAKMAHAQFCKTNTKSNDAFCTSAKGTSDISDDIFWRVDSKLLGPDG